MKATKVQKASKDTGDALKAGPSKARAKEPRQWNPVWLDLALLAVLVGVVYANGLRGEFVFDDQQIVLQNPIVQHIENWSDAIRAGNGFRQLLYVTYGLNFLWGNLDPFNYHVTNVLIHLIDVILVYFIIRRIAPTQKARAAALAGSAVFSVHTLLSAGVSYITARSSTLCALFYFCAILCFLKGRSAAPIQRLREGRYLAGVLAFGWFALTIFCGYAAWQTKQEAIALPVFLAGLVWLQSERKDWRTVALLGGLAAIPLATVWLLWGQFRSIIRAVGENTTLVNAGFDTVPDLGAYLRMYITAIVEYCFPRFLIPIGLSPDPHIKPVAEWYSPEFIVAVAVLLGLTFVMLHRARQEPLLSVGLAALLLSPLTAYAPVPLADPILEYRLYIPGLGIALIAGWLSLKVPWPAVAVCVLALAGMTMNRNTVYATPISLWEDAALKSPEKARALFNLGASYQNAARPDEAIAMYRRALALKPNMYAAYSNISAMLVDKGEWDQAEKMLLDVTRKSPNYTEAFINLAVLYLRRGRPDEAIVQAKHAVATNEGSFAAHYNLAEALTYRGSIRRLDSPNPAVAAKEKAAQADEFKESVSHYERTVYLRPDLHAFKVPLGKAYMRIGDRNSAIRVWTEVSELSTHAAPVPLDPRQSDPVVESLGNLASLAVASEPKDLDRAIVLLRKAVARRSIGPDVHFQLGLAYYWKEQHALAIEEFKTSLKQKADYGQAALNLAMEYEVMKDYRQGIAALETYLAQPGVPVQPVGGPYDFAEQARQRVAMLRAKEAAKQ